MKYYYYSRVSTIAQNSARQIENFRKHEGFSLDRLFVDKVQGNVPFMERAEASALFDLVTSESGNPITVVVDSIDRLGRNLIDILHTIERMTQNGIGVMSLKEGLQTLIDGKINPMANIVVSVMGSIAEMERNRIKERTSEGIEIAKAKGKYKGRKFGSIQSEQALLERHAIIVKKLKKGLSVREVAEIFKCSTTTVVKVRKVLVKRKELNSELVED